jgi:hypothetical protein
MCHLQASLTNGRANGSHSLQVNHQIRSQKLARPFLLDLRLHVLARDGDVLRLDPR